MATGEDILRRRLRVQSALARALAADGTSARRAVAVAERFDVAVRLRDEGLTDEEQELLGRRA